MILEDMQAVADLVVEKYYYRDHWQISWLSHCTKQHLAVLFQSTGVLKPTIHVHLKSVKRGKASWRHNQVIIPMWVGRYAEEYQLYYVLHELAHVLVGPSHQPHGSEFRVMEDKLLSDWDLSIKRMRVYPKHLYSKGQDITRMPHYGGKLSAWKGML